MQCQSVLCNVQDRVGKVPRHRNLYKSKLFRHLNKEKNKTTKPVQTLERPPFLEGPNLLLSDIVVS